MKRLPLLTLVAVLALGVTACGGGDDPEAGATSDPATSATTSDPTEATETTSDPASGTPTEATTETPTASPTVTLTPTPDPTAAPTPTQTAAPTPQPPTGGGVPRTFDAALTKFEEQGRAPQELRRFRTKSGIYCLLQSDFAVGCELPGRGVPDPDYCGDGPTDTVGRVVFMADGSGPTAECNSDTIREPGAPLLAVGSIGRSSASNVACLVEATAVTCIDRSRTQGFYLGSDDYAIFNAG